MLYFKSSYVNFILMQGKLPSPATFLRNFSMDIFLLWWKILLFPILFILGSAFAIFLGIYHFDFNETMKFLRKLL